MTAQRRIGGRRLAILLGAGAVLVGSVALAGLARLRNGNPGGNQLTFEPRGLTTAARTIQRTEKLIWTLGPQMPVLNRSLMNLALPGETSLPLFYREVTTRRLSGTEPPVLTDQEPALGMQAFDWPVSQSERRIPVRTARPLHPLLSMLEYLDYAEHKLVAGSLSGDAVFSGQVELIGRGRHVDGRIVSFKVNQDVTWRRDPSSSTAWRIAAWKVRQASYQVVPQVLFDDVLERAIRDPAQARRARRSIHEERYLRAIRSGKLDHATLWVSDGLHPSVSVVDIDCDGLDDLFVTQRSGPCLLFHNQGDGTLKEIAASWDLDLIDVCCALFADFDNDGDPDLFVGSSSGRARYFINHGGRFKDSTKSHIPVQLPGLVTSAGAADVNGDGLLDVYLATYFRMPIDLDSSILRLPEKLRTLEANLDAQQYSELVGLMRSPDTDPIQNQPGPRNVLLINRGGGRFEQQRHSNLSIARNTFQASWSDFDGDGDPDLYCANDFAPNNLFRNVGGGRFEDTTHETSSADVGFGMGAAWGDYDNDGAQDLYVSNMYSSAGSRIVASDLELRKLARGNTLLRNVSGRFSVVSGRKPPDLLVEKTGWSWGGQFADLDNDGDLDLHVLNGFLTSPLPTTGDL